MKNSTIILLILLFTSSLLFSQDTTYKVKRVIDGDTIELENGEKVRLIGIDTPEAGQHYGKEASNFTRKMVEGKQVRIIFDVQKKDRYNRLLAYVFLEDSTFLNAELLKQGYAKIATYPPNVKYVEKFRQLDQEARENVRGLWAPVLEPTQANTTSQGKTIHTGPRGGKYYINSKGNKTYVKKKKK